MILPFPLKVLTPCAVAAGLMVGGVFVWQEASGADTTPPSTIPAVTAGTNEPDIPASTVTVLVPVPPGADPRGAAQRGQRLLRHPRRVPWRARIAR